MNREIFFELVELKAKTASVLPFLLGICFSWYQYGRLHVGYVLIFFIAMFIFNMAVDILDNYNDYHHATEVHDYKEKTNIIGRENLSLPLIRKMIFWMILVSALMGIGLSFIVGWPLLIIRTETFVQSTIRGSFLRIYNGVHDYSYLCLH